MTSLVILSQFKIMSNLVLLTIFRIMSGLLFLRLLLEVAEVLEELRVVLERESVEVGPVRGRKRDVQSSWGKT